MKRTFTTTLMALLLCVCMVFGLTACGGFTQDDIDNAVNSATADLNSEITALKADIAEKEAKITTLEGEKTALATEKGELEADIQEIEAELTALETEKATLEAEVAALEEEKASLTTDKATLETSITAKNNEIATLNTSISALNTEKANLTARVDELEASIAEKDTQIAELNFSITTLTDRVAELEDENKKLEDEKSELEKENEALKNCLKGNHASDNYNYADNGDGTHDKLCTVCDSVVTANHTFDITTGKCDCGFQAYNLYVGGVQVTRANLTIEDANGGTVTYDPATNTLTLTGYNYTGEGYGWSNSNGRYYGAALYYGGSEPLKLELIGESHITHQSDVFIDSTFGIYSLRGIEVSGEGSLTADGGATGNSTGVHVDINGGDLTVNSGSLTATGTTYGVNCFGDVTVTGGSLTATSTNSGVTRLGAFTVEGGEVLVTGGRVAFEQYNKNISCSNGYYRNAEDGVFSLGTGNTRVGGNYFAFVGADHVTTAHEDGKHTISCKDTDCLLQLSNAETNYTMGYTASGSTITAACSANCGYSETATISATGKTYDGTAVTANVSYSENWTGGNLTIAYATKDGAALTEAPKDAGTYTASISLGEGENAVTASVDFTIEP